MLADLRIRSLAVIEDLEIAFEPGFNVITGETGAGKTMLMRALALVLGGRGDVDLVREGEAEAEIEALFAGPAIGAARARRSGTTPRRYRRDGDSPRRQRARPAARVRRRSSRHDDPPGRDR
jgi:DNA repair ATPase RecN